MTTQHPRTTRSPLVCFGAFTLVLASMIAACSSSSGSLTREAFLEQGNAICGAGNAAIATAAASGGEMTGPPTGPQAQAIFDTVTTEVTKIIAGLRGLTPPAELEADYTAMMTEADIALANVKAATPEEFFAMEDDPFAKANEIADKIGLTVCAEG